MTKAIKKVVTHASRWVWAVVFAVVSYPPLTFAANAQLTEADFVSLPGGKVELRFGFDKEPPNPRDYVIDTPARVIIDLAGVENKLGMRSLDVKTGSVDSVKFAQTDGRLRMVVNLHEKMTYETFLGERQLSLVLAEKPKAARQKTSPMQRALAKKEPEVVVGYGQESRITGIDFERIDGGIGRVSINLTDDQPKIDVQEENRNIVIHVSGASLSGALEKRLDVQDFGTPVKFIDSLGSGNDSTVLIHPGKDDYDYMVYQSGSQVILDFKPPVSEATEETAAETFVGQEIDLNFQNVDLRSVLQIIAEVAELNLVVSDAVGGDITLHLKNVPWDQALDIILKTKFLDKRIVGNVLLVAPADEIAARETQELENTKKIDNLAPLRTEFVQVDYRKASEMMTRLQEAKMISERGFVVADDETNVLMIRETAASIDEIRRTIAKFDVEVEQVIIEARLVTASASVSEELGVRWGFGYQDDDDGISINSSMSGIGFPAASTTIGQMVDLAATAANASTIAIGIKPGSSSLLGLELSALESDGKAEVVSQPKVMTTNGKAAKIESGTSIPYTTKASDGSTTTEYKDATLLLDVTPRVNPGDRISLELRITQNSPNDSFDEGVGVDKNELETEVVVPDGQTVVLGGIFKKTSQESVTKTPLLGDIPVLGALFRKSSTTGGKSELLIFITPKLVRKSLSIE